MNRTGNGLSTAMDTTVRDDRGQHRFEVFADGELAGMASYDDRGGTLAFTHTKIDPRFEGRGLGSTLIRWALDDVRRRGLAAEPYCPFVKGFITRHPDYVDLVPAERWAQFGLTGRDSQSG
jgi:predicted GNAT family acetyltransferase